MVLFKLYLREDINEDGTLKEGVEGRATHADAEHVADKSDEHDEEKALKEAREKLGPAHGEETSADDVD